MASTVYETESCGALRLKPQIMHLLLEWLYKGYFYFFYLFIYLFIQGHPI